VECFSSLSPKCQDEELEDLVYFVLDLYQFHGVPVAISEVDVDQVVVDLRGVLEECAFKRSKSAKDRSRYSQDEHIFLVLDKNLQAIPWESIPSLRGRSVSRIPSIHFLHDRLDFARLCQKPRANLDADVDRAVINPRKGYYVLNPGGDLSKTEDRFRDWLKSMETVGWDGVCGRAPSEQQLVDALSRSDLVM
jgi:separase